MLRFLAILFLVMGYSYQAQAALTVTLSNPLSRPADCPRADSGDPQFPSNMSVTVKHNDTDNSSHEITMTIRCADSKLGTKDKRLEKKQTLNKGEASFGVNIADLTVNTGYHCVAEAISTDSTAGEKKTPPNAPFKIGFPQIRNDINLRVTDGITAGQEFNIDGFSMNNDGVPLHDVVLRECSAVDDPWIFWLKSDSELVRVYPTSSTDIHNKIPIIDGVAGNDNQCLGEMDGQLTSLFTIGEKHTDCKLKIFKDTVKEGDAIAEYGEIVLTGAVVDIADGNVMVHTGEKPDLQDSTIQDEIVVFISTNRGVTWTKSSTITAWSDVEPEDSGIDAASGNTDNTRNMAMIRFTDGTKIWWRIIKGQ